MSKKIGQLVKLSLAILILCGCSPQSVVNKGDHPQITTQNESHKTSSIQLLVIDCLLPGQVRKLGTSLTFVTPRRPIRTTGVDCGIRGGEYVSYDRADYRTALNVWLESAKGGDAKSQVYVGEIFEKGLGTLPDHVSAAAWYKKAADQGDSRGAINLGYLYEKGLGVKKNTITALNWYRKASGLEDNDLQFASTIEAANEQQLSLLRKEIVQGKRERESLQTLLRNKEQQLQQKRNVLSSSQRSLDELKLQLDTHKNLQRPDTTQDVALKNKLLNQQDQVAKQRRENVKLKVGLDEQQNRLHQLAEAFSQRRLQFNQTVAKQRVELDKLNATLSNSKGQLANAEQQLIKSNLQLSKEQNKTTITHQKLINSTSVQEQAIQQLERNIGEQRINIRELQASLLKQTKSADSQKNKLNQQIDQQRLETDTLSTQYLHSQQSLTNAEKQLIDTKALLGTEQNKSKQALQASELNLAEVRRLQVKMIQRKVELETQRKHIASLELEVTNHKNKLKTPPHTNNLAVLKGPSIEILDPPITLTRGVLSVQLRSMMKDRIITGKVVAPSGLLTLNMNDSALTPDKYGIFRSAIPLEDRPTPVSIVAVDKRGLSTKINFNLLPKLRLASTSLPAPQVAPITQKSGKYPVDFGNYHALIIGNNDYTNFNNLNSAVNDAREVDRILKEKYAFETTLLLNADRYSILSALNKLREELTEDDNLLIYYAGHGELDQVNQRGHWLPIDAEPNSTANWISNIDITDILNAISARHIMVIADSCYSGTMTRSSLARLESGMTDKTRLKWFKVMAKTRSRSVLTSGGLKPVLDSGKSGHSIFANAFFEVLKQNNDVLEGYKIYRLVSEKVSQSAAKYNIDQTPQYAPILHAGHEAGEFFFVPRKIALSNAVTKNFTTAYSDIQQSNSL